MSFPFIDAMRERDILRRTSRSFYLTIRLLPRGVRGDVSLAYLLARATDTIADTSTAPPEKRAALLREARNSVGKTGIEGFDADVWARDQRAPAEADLLRALPRLWTKLPARDETARILLIRVMDRILEGQIFDLERFGPEAPPLTPEELERYTFLVAGSVGEFWHDLCRHRFWDYSRDNSDVMRRRARHYGQGLQLVNIIRDRAMDDALGRVYLPEGEVDRAESQARAWLGEGAEYCAALRSGRLRYATLLPALLGLRTLGVSAAQPRGTLTPAKVSRSELRRWICRAISVWFSASAVMPLVRAASR